MEIDEKDRLILDVLKANSKLSTSKISKKTGIPIATVHNRIKKMEKEKIILNYTVKVDKRKLGKNITGYVLVHYDLSAWQKNITEEEFKRRILMLPCVEEVRYLTGRFDLFLKVELQDMNELSELVLNRLQHIPGIGQTETMLVIEKIK